MTTARRPKHGRERMIRFVFCLWEIVVYAAALVVVVYLVRKWRA
jgi:hypothetical protein